ncbi:hypothetical protein [Hoyosella subflava]
MTELGHTLVTLVQMLDDWGANYLAGASQSQSRSRIR